MFARGWKQLNGTAPRSQQHEGARGLGWLLCSLKADPVAQKGPCCPKDSLGPVLTPPGLFPPPPNPRPPRTPRMLPRGRRLRRTKPATEQAPLPSRSARVSHAPTETNLALFVSTTASKPPGRPTNSSPLCHWGRLPPTTPPSYENNKIRSKTQYRAPFSNLPLTLRRGARLPLPGEREWRELNPLPLLPVSHFFHRLFSLQVWLLLRSPG